MQVTSIRGKQGSMAVVQKEKTGQLELEQVRTGL